MGRTGEDGGRAHGDSELGIFRVRREPTLARPSRGLGGLAEGLSRDRKDFFFGRSVFDVLFNK